MRHVNLEYSRQAVDLTVVGMLPAELRDLVHAFMELRFAASPGGSRQLGRRHSHETPTADDPAHRALRTYENTHRMAISRMAKAIDKRLRESKVCKVCKAESSWDELRCEHCGAWFPKRCPKCHASNHGAADVCERCGVEFVSNQSRTDAADA